MLMRTLPKPDALAEMVAEVALRRSTQPEASDADLIRPANA